MRCVGMQSEPLRSSGHWSVLHPVSTQSLDLVEDVFRETLSGDGGILHGLQEVLAVGVDQFKAHFFAEAFFLVGGVLS